MMVDIGMPYTCPLCHQSCQPNQPCPNCNPPKALSPAEQNLADEATVFILAGCMLSVLVSFRDKDHEKTATLIASASDVVNSDPNFPKRFYAAQTAIMAEFNRSQQKTKIVRLHQ